MMREEKTRPGGNRWIRSVVPILILLLGSCSQEPVRVERTTDPTVVAEVQGEKITAGDLRKELEVLERQFRVKDKDDITLEEWIVLRTKALNRIIQDILMVAEAKAQDVRLTRDEIEEALRTAKTGYLENSFEKFLAVEGISPQEWEKKFKNNMLIKKLIKTRVNSKVSVSERDLKKYYENHLEDFNKGERVRSLHIMVETEEEARDIHKKLKSGKKDFSELAQEHSRGPEGVNGGDLGYFEVGQMPEEFDDVFKLNVGQISEVIQTPYGYHIFKVVDKKSARRMSFEESRETIQSRLLREGQDKQFEQWLVDLKNNADIKIDYDVLAKIT